jgi:hypothetical protein
VEFGLLQHVGVQLNHVDVVVGAAGHGG